MIDFDDIKPEDQINENEAPENQETEADTVVGIGSDLKPMNDNPIPPEGVSDEK